MRPLIQNTWRTRASIQTTSRSTQSHQHASKCSCATSSRTRFTTPITGISHSKLQYLRPQGSPSTSVPSATRSSSRTRSRDGIQLMVPIPKGRADRFGTRLRSFSRCVAVFNTCCSRLILAHSHISVKLSPNVWCRSTSSNTSPMRI